VTFSVVGRSADGRSLGVAVASKFLAVGSAVPAARLDLGAIATQSYANTLYKRDGLALLDAGRTAQETLEALLAADSGRETRQAGVVDASGRSATFTGAECLDWAGGVAGEGYAIQGNILAGAHVVEEMQRVWLADPGASLPERLLVTLAAGEAAGGDRRGRQSAALLVVSDDGGYSPGDDTAYDLRVDDHPEPVPELARLLELHHAYFDKPAEDEMLPLEGELATEVRGLLAVLGHPDVETWAGVENFELRVRHDRIDPYALERLRESAHAAG
jgi:uncharacterized Ntn-hydrolase superfamily protein